MTLCVAQVQVAHRSLLGPSRLNANGGSGRTCARERFSHNKGYLGHRPLALWREQARCKTNMIRAYPVDKENEMKRIGALSGMRSLVILLVFQAGYTADVAVADHGIDGPDSLRFELNPLDYVPLAVGNRWTYKHSYVNEWMIDPDWEKLEPVEIPGYPHGQENPIPPDSLKYVAKKLLTIEITHTEMIDGLEYFVFSDADYTWPPLPALFWDGKKVRLSDVGFLVFRWNGQDVPVYDFDHHLDEYVHDKRLKNSYTFTLSGESGTIKVKIERYVSEYELRPESPGPESQYSVVDFKYSSSLYPLSSCYSFLRGYGIGQVYTEGLFLENIIIFRNTLTPISANIDGEEILYPKFPATADYTPHGPFAELFFGLPDTTTSVQPTSWGQLKQLFPKRSSLSQDPP